MIVLCVSGIKRQQGRVDYEGDEKINSLTSWAEAVIMDRLKFVGGIIDHRIVCNPFMLEKGWRTIFFDVPADGISDSARAELDVQLIARSQMVMPGAKFSVLFH